MNSFSLGKRDDYSMARTVTLEQFKKDYRIWLRSYLGLDGMYDSFVADILYEMPFTVVDGIPGDANRFSDAWDLRDQFADANGEMLSGTEDEWPVSVLEVLVILAMKMVYLSDDSPVRNDDDQVGYFYHEMLHNLGIDEDFGGTSESKEKLIRKVITKCLKRRYSKDGSGGLFPLRRPREDQRGVELWYQMNAYMIENY